MWRYYELATDMPAQEIIALRAAVEAGSRHPMEVKADLGESIAAGFHDAAAARAARDAFSRVFRQKEVPEDIETRTLPLGPPLRIAKLLAQCGLASSVSDAQRLIESGAVHLDEQRITNVKADLDCSTPAEHVFKVGKRRFLRLSIR
jgi:tyrosyl-tRNA synthetase